MSLPETLAHHHDASLEARTIVWSRATNALACVRNVVVFRDKSMPTPRDAEAILEQVERLGAIYPTDGVFILHATPDVDHGYPGEETRAAFIELVRKARPHLLGVVYAYAKEGLLGTTVRAVARAMLHAARAGKRSTVVSTIDEAVSWASAHSLATADDLHRTWNELAEPSP